MKISAIFETEEVFEYLEKRSLTKQYQKAKGYLLLGHLSQTNFKLRQPKEAGIYAFRINKKFRALCVYRAGELRVFEVDDHQN